MNTKQVVKYWQNGASDAFDTAKKLMAGKKYHHALFFCHLTLEKILKAVIVKTTHQPALPIHNLNHLAKYAKLSLTPQQKIQLKEINSFNLEARYDDYKLEFYHKATPQFAQKWFAVTKQLLTWLKEK